VSEDVAGHPGNPGQFFPLAFESAVLWLLLLPFLQRRLETGRWGGPYASLFAPAWRNKLMLAEAAVFTGLFWLLLELWQSLFHMLGIDYFKDLFEEPIFIYPVTALTFGIALHLIGSIDRLTSAILEQILNVLKWLAVVAGTLLTLFTLALLFKLPTLVFSGRHAISAVWLLWLAAVIVLLLNAAYRDGTISRPYPPWISKSLRFIVPLTLIVSATALYALIVRAQHYGLTEERVWAFVVAGAALSYSLGYTWAAVGRGMWMGRIGQVNVAVAILLVVTISVMLTPLFSPYRLAANSQFRVALKGSPEDSEKRRPADSPFHYLRFDAGQYGRAKLEELASIQNVPHADWIRQSALEAKAQKERWSSAPSMNVSEFLAKVAVFPMGRAMDPDLVRQLSDDLRKPQSAFAYQAQSGGTVAGLYVDLNGDGVDEFALMNAHGGQAYQNRDGHWVPIGEVVAQTPFRSWEALRDELMKGKITTTEPGWRQLSISGHAFRLDAFD
jgi:hypothetical protein